MRRAFIAAPLLGTLIFLISVLFLVNFQKSEAVGVNNIVGDALHNRLVSLVEIYRSDLGSVFNTGLQRNTEYWLTAQCWQNFASINTQASIENHPNSAIAVVDGAFGNDDDIIDEQEERLYVCSRMSDLVQKVVCSSEQRLNSLPYWIQQLTSHTTFEGVTFDAANREAISRFTQEGGTELCYQLVKKASFDCWNFAEKWESRGPGNSAAPETRLQCCAQPVDANGDGIPEAACPQDKVIYGCDHGNFQLELTISDQEVFPNMPRVSAQDSSGNKVRTGAVADRDYFTPVNFPLYKYLDAAFVFNRFLAYGSPDAQRRADHTNVCKGVVQGFCVGGNNDPGCKSSELLGEFPGGISSSCSEFSPNGPFDVNTQEEAKLEAAKKFAVGPDAPLLKACEYIRENYNYEVEFCLAGQCKVSTENSGELSGVGNNLAGDTWTNCQALLGEPGLETNNDRLQAIANNLLSAQSAQCGSSSNDVNDKRFCGIINQLNLNIRFVDRNPAFRVEPNFDNRFCWFSDTDFLPSS